MEKLKYKYYRVLMNVFETLSNIMRKQYWKCFDKCSKITKIKSLDNFANFVKISKRSPSEIKNYEYYHKKYKINLHKSK